MEPPTPEDEFEIYFRQAAKNKHLTNVILHLEGADDGVTRRGSLPTAVRQVKVEDEVLISGFEEAHHHRTSSCKNSQRTSTKPAGLHHSPSARVASSAKHCSQGDDKPLAAATKNGFLSPLSAAGETTSTSISAPHSRSGSFRKASRGNIRDLAEPEGTSFSVERRRSSVYLEETVAAKLKELKELEDENCLVVRQFTISPTGDIIDRIDSFKKKRESSPRAQQKNPPKTNQLHVPGYNLRVPGQTASLARLVSCEKAHRVLVIGDRRVGKTALMTQFMTSEYLAALDTSFEGEANEKSISVSVDGEEMTLQFTDLEPEDQLEHRKLHPDVDCYLLVYSIADKKSFTYVSSLLRDLNEIKRTFAVIVVANKSDVVRKRQVPDSDAMNLCMKYSAKFIEVSAALNHKVDELLIGIANQIRLNPKRQQKLDGTLSEEPPTPTSVPCSKGPLGFFARLFSKKKSEPKPCENLQTL